MRVVITGASRGIGRGLFDLYAAQGCEVLGSARRPEPPLVALDVTDPDSVQRFGRAWSGAVDLLVCNAGLYPAKGDRLDGGFAAATWAEGFATNVTGVFLTVQAFLPQLRAGRGKIAIIGSTMGSDARAPGGSYIYRASKAAVLNLGRNLAVDLRGDGVAVGVYHPGWVRTDMGGGGAEISVETSARGLAARFAALTLASTGCFESYSGEPLQF